VNELQVSIEERLEVLSDEAYRLRAALDALGPGDASRSSTSPPRTAARGATRRPVIAALAGGRARSTGEFVSATGLAPSTIAAAPSGDGSRLSDGQDRGVANEPTGEADAGTTDNGEIAPADGVDRAVQSLRSELTAGLRTSRRAL
jgi:hypothetical protein